MNKKYLIIIIAIAILGAFYFLIDWPWEKEKITNFEECVAAGNAVMESYPRQCRAGDKTFVEDIGNVLDKTDFIMLESPLANSTVSSPLHIFGMARGYWFFEGDFPVRIEDSNGKVLGIGIAQAQWDWMTEDFIPFELNLVFDNPKEGKGNLYLEKDNPSGLEEYKDELRIPIYFGEAEEETIVNVYFSNSELDPDFSCNIVFPVQRTIPETQGVGRAALEELLKGTLATEEDEGYFTSINPGVEINSIVIENGVAMVDFNEQLESLVGGSCRVSAIRAQITETLKQFPTIDEVIISIDGRTEDILQP